MHLINSDCYIWRAWPLLSHSESLGVKEHEVTGLSQPSITTFLLLFSIKDISLEFSATPFQILPLSSLTCCSSTSVMSSVCFLRPPGNGITADFL
ncbi:hypothetical protein GOODEAATRI_023162 [Goodea atripinnis]|uniref:Uncharacterized protein n=1 Tax=Goodea atripinnis TaxID=208336 RepID=A0ABV0P752_9TELE